MWKIVSREKEKGRGKEIQIKKEKESELCKESCSYFGWLSPVGRQPERLLCAVSSRHELHG